MAQELLYTLKIEGTAKELDRLAQLNVNIKQLGDEVKALSKTDATAAEAKKIQLQAERKEYGELQKQVKNNATQANDNVRTLEKMRAQLANMNKELERTEIGSEMFKKLTADSKKLRDELKGAEEATGRFQSNVGNYKNAVIDAFQAMGINVQQFTSVFEKAGDTFSSVSKDVAAYADQLVVATVETKAATKATTLYTAATSALSKGLTILKLALISTGIGAIVVILGSIVAYLASTQEGLDKINSALKPLGTILQRTLGIVQDLGGALFKIFSGEAQQGWKDLKTTISGIGDELSEAWRQGQKLYDLSIEIRNLQLAIAANEGNINRQIAEQRQILEDVNKSDKVRAAAGKQAIALQNALTELKKQELNKQVEELKLKQDQNDTDIEGKKQLVLLINEIAQLDADNLNKQREIQNKLNALKKKSIDDERAAILERTTLQQQEADLSLESRKKIDESTIQSIETVRLAKEKLRQENEDVIFRLFDEEEINDIPEFIEEIQKQAEQAAAFAQGLMLTNKDIYDQDIFNLKNALSQKLITQEEYNNAVATLEQERLSDGLKMTSDSLNQLSEIFGKESKAGKAAAAAATLINTYVAAMEAYKSGIQYGGPVGIPLGVSMAAIATVFGLKQVQKILSSKTPEPAKYARGVIGLQGSGTETSDSIPARLSQGESVLTAKATRAYAPILAQMERSVGNIPNTNIKSGRFAAGIIPQPIVPSQNNAALIREVVRQIVEIPVIVSESDVTSTQARVRKIKVNGDL